jgi:hemerythrin
MGKLSKHVRVVQGMEGQPFPARDVDQLNRLAEAWRDRAPMERFSNRQFLTTFAIYLVKHFRAEEFRLQRMAAPGLTWHKQEHRQLVRQIWALMNDEALGLDMTDGIQTFLEAWRLHQEVSSRRRDAVPPLSH